MTLTLCSSANPQVARSGDSPRQLSGTHRSVRAMRPAGGRDVSASTKLSGATSGQQLIKGLPQQRPDKKVWLTRHHMHGRIGPARNDPKFIFVCSWQAHEAIEHNLIEIEGDDADQRLIFRWNRRLVPVSKEPFRIKSKRRSQNVDV